MLKWTLFFIWLCFRRWTVCCQNMSWLCMQVAKGMLVVGVYIGVYVWVCVCVCVCMCDSIWLLFLGYKMLKCFSSLILNSVYKYIERTHKFCVYWLYIYAFWIFLKDSFWKLWNRKVQQSLTFSWKLLKGFTTMPWGDQVWLTGYGHENPSTNFHHTFFRLLAGATARRADLVRSFTYFFSLWPVGKIQKCNCAKLT